MSLDEIISKGQERFLYCEDALSAIHLAITTMNNVLLHGKGGYGKTKMAKFVGSLLYSHEEQETVMFGEGTISSSILGGIDMEAMTKEGDILYKPERSWMKRRFVVFEEFLDATGPALENLKYILSEKEFPQRGGKFSGLFETIVGCTNRDPITWCKDSASLSALMQRFPYEQEVMWPSHTYNDYANLFQKTFKKPCPEVSEACEICADHKVIRSPRQAINLQEAFNARGTLAVFAFDREVKNNPACLRAILSVQGKAQYRSKVREVFKLVNDRLRSFPTVNASNANELLEKAKYLEKTLKAVRVDEKLATEYADLLDQVKKAYEAFERYASPTIPEEWKIGVSTHDESVTPVANVTKAF